MIKSISIKNFKSIVDLTLDLGQFNVLIGENGCGKSNILEGIAFGTAALSGKLEREYFANRGIRYSDSTSLYSAFNCKNEKYIKIDIEFGHFKENLNLFFNQDAKPEKWEIESKPYEFNEKIKEYLGTDYTHYYDLINKINTNINKIASQAENLKNNIEDNLELDSRKDSLLNELQQIKFEIFNNKIFKNARLLGNEMLHSLAYLIFSLEESILRKFDAENAIHPLGRNGEGLFAYLKEISQKENGFEILKEIKENLCVLDWFDDLEIPKDQLSNEFSLKIRDKYINDTLHFFDQRSTNEGFLYLLFYLTLFISNDTPSFFAIDNLEASFNPKLCREITKRLILLAKKHNKQVIVTTHSPAILDGLDITNSDERLFVIRRNIDGYTKANRIEYKTETSLALSEAWLKGYIGGLPENF